LLEVRLDGRYTLGGLMSEAKDDWPFLEDAWRYALVLTGSETAALESVRVALEKLARRSDATDLARARRILFASLYRQAVAKPATGEPVTEVETKTRSLHLLCEPGRSALTLMSMGLFVGEELASLLGETLPSLAACLGEARGTLGAQS
jgi:hypothetical protein